MSNGTKESAKSLPPYVPYKTFSSFIEGLRNGIPGRIDKSLMKTMSGAMQNQLVGALRYLGLIDEQGIPQESLDRLTSSHGEERQQVLQEIIQSSYSFFFNGNGFNLATATTLQFDEKLKETGATGDTVRKCAAFFLGIARDAGMTISPRIESTTRQRTDRSRAQKPRTAQRTRKPPADEDQEIPPPPPGRSAGAQQVPVLTVRQMLVAKLPDFDPTWTPEVQKNWIDVAKHFYTWEDDATEEIN